MDILVVLGVFVAIVGGIIWSLVKIVSLIDDWADDVSPEIKDLRDFSQWKIRNGFIGYQTSAANEKLRRMYDSE